MTAAAAEAFFATPLATWLGVGLGVGLGLGLGAGLGLGQGWVLATSSAAEEAEEDAEDPWRAEEGREWLGGGGDDETSGHGACGSVCAVRSHLVRGGGSRYDEGSLG